jgi:3-dehydroquinate synthase
MEEVFVSLKKEIDQSYPILIRPGLLAECAGLLEERFGGLALALISDSNVTGLYAADLVRELSGRGFRKVELVTFPAGEQSKTREMKARLEDSLFRAGLGRDSLIAALGGGVVGDLAGYVAATYSRGVPFVQVPTTLLSMVDASVGGKTGVDVPWGKNLVGAFHQPSLVLIDPRVLRTLERRQFLAGMAEAVKHGVIRDSGLFDLIEGELGGILALEENSLSRLIAWNCRIKAAVVAEDEREANLRQILNFGHTVGHAVETVSGYQWLHGEALACGMVAEAEVAVEMGLLSAGESRRIDSLLRRIGLKVTLSGLGVNAESLLELTALDKKARGGAARYALPEAIGRMARTADGSYGIPVDKEVVRRVLIRRGAIG